MKGLVLNWDSAHSDATDTAHRNMRARRAKNPRLLERLSVADHNIYVARLEHLAVLFYRANICDVYGPVDIRIAWMALAETKGDGCYFEKAPAARRSLSSFTPEPSHAV